MDFNRTGVLESDVQESEIREPVIENDSILALSAERAIANELFVK